MPYLDEDILYNNVEEKYKSAKGKAREAYSDVLDTICEMPRADVVPKSEVENYKQVAEYQQKLAMDRFFEIKRLEEDVERWRRNLEAVLEERAEEKSEVAREIFAEIEKYVEVALMNGHIETPILCIGHSTFAELKKKYTEEKK